MISDGILLIQLESVMISELFIGIAGASIISVTFQNFARPDLYDFQLIPLLVIVLSDDKDGIL